MTRKKTRSDHTLGVYALRHQQGDPYAFTDLVKESEAYRETAALGEKRKRPDLSLEDIRNVILEALWKAAETYDPKEGAFDTYMRWKVRGKISNLARAKRRKQNAPYTINFHELEEGDRRILENIASPSHTEYYEEERQKMEYEVRTFLETLPPSYQHIAYMRFGEGLTTTEIGEKMGKIPQGIHQKVQRLERKLHEIEYFKEVENIPETRHAFMEAMRQSLQDRFNAA